MATKALLDKFDALTVQLKRRLVEKDDEIEIIKLAILARTHAFFYGEPGIAKTLGVDLTLDHIDGLSDDDYVHLLFMKGTTREDVFGPLDLSLLQEGHYYYKPEGYLPNAKFFFGDEFWKANSAIVNALLWAVNERKYRNDGKIYDLPLHSCFIASNELPDDDSLLAIYDRFPLRTHSHDIVETGAFIDMLRAPTNHITPVITWDDITAACAEVDAVDIPLSVDEGIAELRTKLAALSIRPSPRRFKQARQIVKAAAWLDGEDTADNEHLACFRWIMWDNPENIPEVEKLCSNLANPAIRGLDKIKEEITKVSAELEEMLANPPDEMIKQRIGQGFFMKVNDAKEDLIKFEGEAKKSRKVQTKYDAVDTQVKQVAKRLLTQVFKTSPEDFERNQDKLGQQIKGVTD